MNKRICYNWGLVHDSPPPLVSADLWYQPLEKLVKRNCQINSQTTKVSLLMGRWVRSLFPHFFGQISKILCLFSTYATKGTRYQNLRFLGPVVWWLMSQSFTQPFSQSFPPTPFTPSSLSIFRLKSVDPLTIWCHKDHISRFYTRF